LIWVNGLQKSIKSKAKQKKKRVKGKKKKMDNVTDLKRDVFFRLLEMVGRVFIIVRHSDSVEVGRRGFLDKERENGLVLVFNKKMKFLWDDDGIHATLVFGTSAEKCFIPPKDIISVYSPELKVHLVVTPEDKMAESGKQGDSEPDAEQESEKKVIRVDFKRKG